MSKPYEASVAINTSSDRRKIDLNFGIRIQSKFEITDDALEQSCKMALLYMEREWHRYTPEGFIEGLNEEEPEWDITILSAKQISVKGHINSADQPYTEATVKTVEPEANL